jgi:hypothetical protein
LATGQRCGWSRRPRDVAELAEYRRYHALAVLPAQSEGTPLVTRFPCGDRPLTRAAQHHTVKAIFRGAADRLLELGGEAVIRDPAVWRSQ